MKTKFGFMIVVALLMVGIVSGDISSEEFSPAPSRIELQSETEMSPSPSPSDSESKSPTMPDDYIYQPPSQSPEASDLNHTDVTGTESEKYTGGGGKKAGIAVGGIAAASFVGVGGYVLKKRRENLRRSRYEYAATEII